MVHLITFSFFIDRMVLKYEPFFMPFDNPHKRSIQKVAATKRLLLLNPRLSIREACRQVGCNRATYYHWYDKLDKLLVY